MPKGVACFSRLGKHESIEHDHVLEDPARQGRNAPVIPTVSGFA